MFMGPSVSQLDKMGFSRQLPLEDQNGNYTVRSDDGQTILFQIAFERFL
jgi:hypothetical protein